MIENEDNLLLGRISPSGDITGAMMAEKGAKGDPGEPGQPGQDGENATIEIGTTTTGAAGTQASVVNVGTDTHAILNFTIPKGQDGTGGVVGGDMYKATYDTNDNGIVDNAEKVNNHSVESDVPANAKFTDTTYTAGTGIDITNGVISNTQTSAEWGNISGTLSSQTDLQNALNDKANTNDIPHNTSDLINDSGFLTQHQDISGKQDTLVSGTNIKTINDTSVLGSGNINTKEVAIQTTQPTDGEKIWIDPNETLNIIGSEITTEYSISDKLGYSCNYINDKVGVVLFEGNSTSNITLNDSIFNYKKITIQFKGNNGSFDSVDYFVTGSITDKINLTTSNYYLGTIYMQSECITISNNKITRSEQKEAYLSTSVSIHDTNVYITKVIGYK